MQVSISSPEIQTYFFIAILFFILLISIKKRDQSVFFDINVTNELKGLAVLMIIFAHIGYFLVSDHRFLFPLSVGGGIGVNLFLFLSGYGLSVSSIKRNLSILDFYKKRVIKLFIPLWTVLIIFLVGDYLLLNRTYRFDEVWHAFLGYFPRADLTWNINSPLWFATLIIIYYLLFPIIFNKKYLSLSAIFMIMISYILLFNSTVTTFLVSNNWFTADLLKLYRTHFVAFPLGLIVADLITNKTTLHRIWFFFAKFLSGHKKILFVIYYLSLLATLYISWYTAIYSGVGKGDLTEQFISLITSAAIVYLFIFNKIKFGFSIIGIYSYEIYLLHWPILSRFDIFYKFLPPFLATSFYLILFIFLGFILNKFTNLISNKLLKIV